MSSDAAKQRPNRGGFWRRALKIAAVAALLLLALPLLLYLRLGYVGIDVLNDSDQRVRVVASSPDLIPSRNRWLGATIGPGATGTIYYPREKMPRGGVVLTDPRGRRLYVELTCRGFGGCSIGELTKRVRLSQFGTKHE